MKPAARFSLLLALLLLSLGVKVVTLTARFPPSDAIVARTLVARLRALGFEAVVQHRPLGLAVVATRGACRLLVRDDESGGARTAVYESAAEAYGPLRYAYRGQVSGSAPRWRPLLDRIIARRLARFGIDRRPVAVLAVASSTACGPAGRLFEGL